MYILQGELRCLGAILIPSHLVAYPSNFTYSPFTSPPPISTVLFPSTTTHRAEHHHQPNPIASMLNLTSRHSTVTEKTR